MHIEHLAIWVKHLPKMMEFYRDYFKGIPGPLYQNTKKNFTSCFISFESGGRLELMHNPDKHTVQAGERDQQLGIAHLAFSTGSKAAVDSLTTRLADDGYRVIGDPRTTGDGYYESVVLDPESNRIEITI